MHFSLGAVVGSHVVGLVAVCALHSPIPECLVQPQKAENKEPGEANFLVRTYGVVVGKSLAFAPLIVVIAYGAVYSSSTLFSSVKQEMFPLSERAEFLIYLDMPKGTAISATEKEALAVERWLLDKDANPEVKDTTVFVGDGGPRFYLALNPADTNPASAFILVNTTSFDSAVTAAERAYPYLAGKSSLCPIQGKATFDGGR